MQCQRILSGLSRGSINPAIVTDIHRLWLSSSLDIYSDEVYDRLLFAVPCFSGVVVKANNTHEEQIRKTKSSTGYMRAELIADYYIYTLILV